MSQAKRTFPALGERNYRSWADDINPTAAPELYSETTPTIEDKREQRKWEA
ncbi:hypothetical protein GLOTRDRAFT_130502 [Gloeophyllum trabeum ATCC 11539]|uniref:Uncharacterized protein n=1 Tax=Gloeophyllum trabeum (strain ATCC 11539 / FP-39264 / Madison 617) TaxID=670483 RepID=S7Q3I4_GLOTA|nr:uncharacterized protein GLOTRDRAFT_130502 [Gloeophyllum trabeum ATCC 11539]EPQ54117.1 hypothetical protein GLOTRDRAFT_130502 [Gloeophyllum trabeum ATCC 11539]